MPSYLSLLRFTDKGAANLRKSPTRAAAFAKAAAKHGVRVAAQSWTVGAYDGFLLLSADTESKVLRCLADLVAGGNVRTETLRAFDAAEFAKITAA
jgi:uncharacterized protein with GYD domain